MAKLKYDLSAVDNASAVIKKVATAAKKAATEMLKNDSELSKSTMDAAKAKQLQLTLSQKYKFAIEKEAAAGNKLKTQLVNQKEALAKSERALRAAIKAGDESAETLAKETVALRENVAQLKKKDEKQEESAISMRGYAKVVAAAAAAVTGATAGAFLLTKRFAEQNDAIRKNSERLTLSVEGFQKLDYAMKISGTSIEENEGALNSFTKQARDAAKGTGAGVEAFKFFGVALEDSEGRLRNTGDLLLDLAEGFKASPAGAERTAAAMDLFGESGGRLTQFLSLGKAGIADLGAEFTSLGGVVSETSARQSEEFNDSLLRMETAMRGTGAELTTNLEPVFTRAMNQVAESVGRLREVYKPVFDGFMRSASSWGRVVVPIAVGVGKAFVLMGKMVLDSWNGLKAIINGVLATLVGALNKARELENTIRRALNMEELEMHFNAFSHSFQENIDDINASSLAAVATFEELDKIGEALVNQEAAKADKTDEAIKKEKTYRKAIAARSKTEAAASTAAVKARETEEKAIDRLRASNAEWFASFPALEKMSANQAKEFIKTTEQQTKAATALGISIGDKIGGAVNVMLDDSREMGDRLKAVFGTIVDASRDAAVSAISSYAASSAGAAFFSQAGIPVIGPALAAGAASVAFALVSGYANRMNKGGIVPGSSADNTDSQLTWLTPGELVIPKDLTRSLLEVAGRRGSGRMNDGGIVDGGGGGGLTINLNESGNFMPRTPAELDHFVRDRLVPALNRLKRQGAYA